MPNIEIKAKCSNLEKAKSVAEDKKTDYLGILHQIDTYYETKKGRLKIREINGEKCQLIPYCKDYSKGPMKSDYELMAVDNPKNLKGILNNLLGEIAVVDKKREVFLIDNVRIHLDKVENLGSFIEFEAVYEDEALKDQEFKKVNELMTLFNITENDLLDKSYVDYFIGADLL